MSHSNLTRWIENAEARQVLETAQVGRGWSVNESHFLHLGEMIAKVPFWHHHPADRDALAALGGDMLALIRHPLARKAA
jgi:hypothetical protein